MERDGRRIFLSPDEVPPERRPTEEQLRAAREQLAAFNTEVRKYDHLPPEPRSEYNRRFWWDSADADTVPRDGTPEQLDDGPPS